MDRVFVSLNDFSSHNWISQLLWASIKMNEVVWRFHKCMSIDAKPFGVNDIDLKSVLQQTI